MFSFSFNFDYISFLGLLLFCPSEGKSLLLAGHFCPDFIRLVNAERTGLDKRGLKSVNDDVFLEDSEAGMNKILPEEKKEEKTKVGRSILAVKNHVPSFYYPAGGGSSTRQGQDRPVFQGWATLTSSSVDFLL